MSPRPDSSGPLADELYEQLEPLAVADEANGWALLHYVSGLLLPAEDLEALVRDTDVGPGWSALVDLDRCPVWALGWLAQFVGVRLLPRDPAEAEEDWAAAMRERIARADGRNRGGPDALRAAAERYLTGTKHVLVNERAGGDAYALNVVTYTGETPDPAAVLRALLEQKPAGIVLTHSVVPGYNYDEIEAGYDDYDDLAVTFDNYDDLAYNTP